MSHLYIILQVYTPASSHTKTISRTSKMKVFFGASAKVKTSVGLRLIPWLSLRFFLT